MPEHDGTLAFMQQIPTTIADYKALNEKLVAAYNIRAAEVEQMWADLEQFVSETADYENLAARELRDLVADFHEVAKARLGAGDV